MDQAQRGRWWLNRAQLVLFDKRGGRDKGAEQSRLSHDEGEFLGWWRWVGLVWVSACKGEWKSHTHSTHTASPPTRLQRVYVWLNPCLFFLLYDSFWHCRANCCFPLPYLVFCKKQSMSVVNIGKCHFSITTTGLNISTSSGWHLPLMSKREVEVLHFLFLLGSGLFRHHFMHVRAMFTLCDC